MFTAIRRIHRLKAVILRPFAAPSIAAPPQSPADYPGITLGNGCLSVDIALPGDGGYYQGTRFDHSGLIRVARFGEHAFFGEWKPSHIPDEHDAVAGPAEEFGMWKALGYDDARVGKPFYKIGVGALRRMGTGDYHYFHVYPLIDRGKWTVAHGSSWAQFIQEIDGERGWSFRYTKRIELNNDKPALTITHILENTGANTIETNQYCHNFVRIDDQPIGPDYIVDFDFTPQIKDDAFQHSATAQGNSISFQEPLDGPIHTKFSAPDTETFVCIKNRRSGAALEIRGDYAATEWRIYAVPTELCPEPFLSLTVQPGMQFVWHSYYTFSAAAEAEEARPR